MCMLLCYVHAVTVLAGGANRIGPDKRGEHPRGPNKLMSVLIHNNNIMLKARWPRDLDEPFLRALGCEGK